MNDKRCPNRRADLSSQLFIGKSQLFKIVVGVSRKELVIPHQPVEEALRL